MAETEASQDFSRRCDGSDNQNDAEDMPRQGALEYRFQKISSEEQVPVAALSEQVRQPDRAT